jgi:aryl-alcohol dehydrogenase-like predicted oxidoreductase
VKLALGTVQFGLSYGISNAHGKPTRDEIESILENAKQNGVELLDTASQYGDSEQAIGASNKGRHFKVVTKTPSFESCKSGAEASKLLEHKLLNSLENLNSKQIYGLLFHDPKVLSGPFCVELVRKVTELKESGVVQKIGVSIYDEADIEAVLKLFIPDIIQLPINIIDQRLLKSGMLKELKKRGVEIHARSLFLQGALLMEAGALPPTFDSARPHFSKIFKRAQESDLTMLEICLGFVDEIDEINYFLVGVNKLHELQEIINALSKSTKQRTEILKIAHDAQWFDEKILNPARWN